MNPSDDDLNCLLKAWTVPRSPDSLEGRLRRSYRDRARSGETLGLVEVSPALWTRAAGRLRRRGPGVWAPWIAGFVPIAGKFAGVIAGAVVLLAMITRAFPQSLRMIAGPNAITIDSEYLDYNDDGSPKVSEYRTSYFSSTGGETTLLRSFPGDPLRTAAEGVLNPMRAILDPIARVIDPLFYKPGRAEYLKALAITEGARIRNDCAPINMWGRPMTVINEDTVLNYATTVSQYEFRDERFTEWLALGLNCFSLKSTKEKALADGAFRLVSERRVLKVTTNASTIGAKEPNR